MPLNAAWSSDPRIDAAGLRSQPGDDDPEEREDGEPDQEAVREPEEHPRGHDREHDAVRREQGEAETSIGELLHEGCEECHREEEGDERGGPARIPLVGDEALLFRRIEVSQQREDAGVGEREDVDENEAEDRESEQHASRTPAV